MLRGDVKIQVAATATVCGPLQKVAILLFNLSHDERSNISIYFFDTMIYVYLDEFNNNLHTKLV